jgi:F-type H+-transporting ATPase subunit a
VVACNWLGSSRRGNNREGEDFAHGDTVHEEGTVFNEVAGVNMILPGFPPRWPPHEPESLELEVAEDASFEEKEAATEEATKDLKEDEKAGVLIPFLRSVNTDLNATLTLAIMSAIFVEFWGISTLGFFKYSSRFINFRGGPIGFFVGFLELIAEVARLLSFTFRLFGNIFAGEILFLVILFMVPVIGVDLVYGMELFVGLIQVFIFAMLTLVFGVMAVTSHEDSEHHEDESRVPA